MAEEMILVCADRSFFPDDMHGQCPCGQAIVYRPHNAFVATKICPKCADDRLKKTSGTIRMGVTEKTFQEVQQFMKARGN